MPSKINTHRLHHQKNMCLQWMFPERISLISTSRKHVHKHQSWRQKRQADFTVPLFPHSYIAYILRTLFQGQYNGSQRRALLTSKRGNPVSTEKWDGNAWVTPPVKSPMTLGWRVKQIGQEYRNRRLHDKAWVWGGGQVMGCRVKLGWIRDFIEDHFCPGLQGLGL